VANLKVMRLGSPDDCVMVGPVVRDATTLDPRLRMTEHVEGRPAIRFIGLETFGKLIGNAGWTIARALDGPYAPGRQSEEGLNSTRSQHVDL
jgi:hypothetical protein